MIIETERLLLRKPILEDFEEYWLMKNDRETTKYTGGITPYSYEKRRELFKKEWIDANQNTEFSIALKATMDYIGYCSFIDKNELIYGIKKNVWQNSYGHEAARAMLSYGFTVLNFSVIVATVNPQNIASEKILQKIGLTFDYALEESGIVLHKYKLDAIEYSAI